MSVTLKEIIEAAKKADASEDNRVLKVGVAADKKVDYDAAHADGEAATKQAADDEAALQQLIDDYKPSVDPVP
jgi:hypothetical protein